MVEFIILAILATAIGVGGQTILKKRVNQVGEADFSGINTIIIFAVKAILNPYVLSGLFLSSVAAFFWISILSKNDLSFAYPLCSGLFFIAILFSSKFFLKENINFYNLAGTAVIFIGFLIMIKSRQL